MKNIYIPPEWAPHQATWFTWPHNQETWPTALKAVNEQLIRVVNILSEVEEVHIGVNDIHDIHYLDAKFNHSQTRSNIFLHQAPSNDAWARDHGSIFGQNSLGERIGLNFQYNAWGGKYLPYGKDNAIGSYMSDIFGGEQIKIDLVLEGGAIDLSGDEILMTTKECLLHPNRNPQLDQTEIEKSLKYYFNVKDVLWLDRGIEGDDTDGHIDEIARFVSKDRIIVMTQANPNDVNYHSLNNNLDRLKRYQEIIHDIDIVELAMPSIELGTPHIKFPASYANFYIANEIVLLPIFDCKQDDQAIKIISACFPTRDVIPIDSRAFMEGLGGIHCLTQQIPKIS